MKAKFAIAAIALALTSASAFASLEELAKGEVTFNGEVKSASCNVAVNRQGTDGYVKLATIDKSDLVNGQAVAETPFTIEVYACDFSREGKFDATWTTSTGLDKTTGYLDNQATQDAATNVSIALTDAISDELVIPGTDSAVQSNKLTGESRDGATFSYRAGYITDDRSAATAGQVVGKATYTISYN